MAVSYLRGVTRPWYQAGFLEVDALPLVIWGRYHEGRRPSSDDSFHSPTVIPPSALDKPSIMKLYHHRRTTRWGVAASSPTMVTFHDTRFVKCQWWNDGWTVKTVVTWQSSASMIQTPGNVSCSQFVSRVKTVCTAVTTAAVAAVGAMFIVGCLTSRQHASASQGRIRQFYVLPHWDRSCRSNFPSHPVTVYWHRASQSQRWPCNARRLAG